MSTTLNHKQKNHVSIPHHTLQAAKHGSHKAFETIVLAYERPIYSFIYKLTSNHNDTLDLTQDTFVKLYNNIHKLDENKNIGAWLFTMARTTVYDHFRKTQRRPESFTIDDPDNPFEIEDEKDKTKKVYIKLDVEHAMNNIKPMYKEILTLYYWHELRYKEIADQLNISINTVKTRLRRAKFAFRDELHYK